MSILKPLWFEARLPVVVALPARDEAGCVAQALGALRRQVSLTGEPLRDFGVLVLANNCGDNTAEVARQALKGAAATWVLETRLPPHTAHVGSARRIAFQAAARRLRAYGAAHGVIATTDADSVVAPDWVARTRAAFESPQAHSRAAVGGRIELAAQEWRELPRLVAQTQQADDTYHLLCEAWRAQLYPDPHDPWPRHHQHFGASLAVRLSALEAVGGVPAVRSLEDVALIEALRRAEFGVRHDPAVRVSTSARRSGKVEMGLSTQLREWERGPAYWTVPGAAELEQLWRAEHTLKTAYAARSPSLPITQALADMWLTPLSALQHACTLGSASDALQHARSAREQARQWRRAFPAVPVQQAVSELRLRLSRVGVAADYSRAPAPRSSGQPLEP